MLRLLRRRFLAALLLSAVAMAPSLPARAAEAPPAIQSFYDVLLEVMKNAEKLGFDGRAKLLDPIIRKTFDLPLMTRLAVGPQWQSLTEGQQKQLTDAFSGFTIATYASRFDDYSGEKFEVDKAVTANANGTVVQSRIVKSNGEKVTLNYLMKADGEAWRIMDVFLSGTVSELASRRSEFSAVLRRDGADALVKLLEKRTADAKNG